MRRTTTLIALLLLAACGKGERSLMGGDGESGAEPVDEIACALDGAGTFTQDCSMQRFAGNDGVTLVIGRGDSGFRRFVLTGDGRGVVTADGAEQARVRIIGENEVEVQVAGDRYRLPATISGTAPPPGNKAAVNEATSNDTTGTQ